MRLVHISDLHLGHARYQRNPGGVNQRLMDVARAFEAAVDIAIERRPDMVIIAGDTMDKVRPAPLVTVHALRQMRRLVVGLRGAPVLLIAGNHDLPRSAETGCTLEAFAEVGVIVDAYARGRHVIGSATVQTVPFAPGATLDGIEPAATPFNILVVHAAVEGPYRGVEVDDRAGFYVSPEKIPQGFDYIALGDFHVTHEVAPRAWYSGSTEYTSTNVWGEIADEASRGLTGKGMLEIDITSGEMIRHAVPTRPHFDLPEIDARGMTSVELDAALLANIEAVPYAGAVVRQRVTAARRFVRGCNQKALRGFKARALSYEIRVDDPAAKMVQVRSEIPAPTQRPSLEQIVREAIGSRALPADIDRDRLTASALDYMAEAAMAETRTTIIEQTEERAA